MKTCPVCDTEYPDQHATCPTDGAVLIGSHELAPGSLVRGKYRIIRKLGEGGMGVVYLAEDILLGVEVALKFLAGDLGKDPRFIKRFRMEARAAYQLRHRNIVEVTNLDQAEDGSLFIAMEFVEGSSLRGVLEQSHGYLCVSRALEIARGIASGLAAAHAQGTVHRDIKPENVMLSRGANGREEPKILDFGIAAVAESVTRMTRTHGFLLTPEYAAPEQWQELPAEELDGRTDLYALGCVFYEMLTAGTPFHAHNTAGWMKQHLEEAPRPPSHSRPELADWEGLDATVLRLLAKDRTYRPQSAAELLAVLDSVRHVPAEQRPPTIIEGVWKRPETIVEDSWVEETGWPHDHVGLFDHPADTTIDPPKFAVEEPNRLFGRPPIWAWAVCAVLLSAVSFAAWRGFSSHPKTQQIPYPGPPSKLVNQQSGTITNSEPPKFLPPPIGQSRSSASAKTNQTPQTSKPSEQPKPSSSDMTNQAVHTSNVQNQPTTAPTGSPQPQAPAPTLSELERRADSLYSRKDYMGALPLYDQACKAGNAASCRQLGLMYQQGWGVTQSYSESRTLFGNACTFGDAMGCNNLGALEATGNGGPMDLAAAFTSFTKGCQEGFTPSCKSARSVLAEEQGAPRDTLQTADQLAKSCAAGNATDCNSAGAAYRDGPGGVSRDNSRALAMFTTSCNLRNGYGCTALGAMYRDGLGAAKSDGLTVTYFSRGCDYGDAAGCSYLGNNYRYGLGVRENLTMAKQLYARGCQMGNQWGCDQLKQIH